MTSPNLLWNHIHPAKMPAILPMTWTPVPWVQIPTETNAVMTDDVRTLMPENSLWSLYTSMSIHLPASDEPFVLAQQLMMRKKGTTGPGQSIGIKVIDVNPKPYRGLPSDVSCPVDQIYFQPGFGVNGASDLWLEVFQSSGETLRLNDMGFSGPFFAAFCESPMVSAQ